jgi:hypothetical protein
MALDFTNFATFQANSRSHFFRRRFAAAHDPEFTGADQRVVRSCTSRPPLTR